MEAASQSSSALGFAVLEIPDDIHLSDGEVTELSADVTSPEGKTLEDVLCVVDLKASGPAPRPPRGKDASVVDDDVSHPSLLTLARWYLGRWNTTRVVNRLAKIIFATSKPCVLCSITSSSRKHWRKIRGPSPKNGHVDVVSAA